MQVEKKFIFMKISILFSFFVRHCRRRCRERCCYRCRCRWLCVPFCLSPPRSQFSVKSNNNNKSSSSSRKRQKRLHNAKITITERNTEWKQVALIQCLYRHNMRYCMLHMHMIQWRSKRERESTSARARDKAHTWICATCAVCTE